MAVCLLREGERKPQVLTPETRSLPRVTVRNQPVVAAPRWGGSLRARTPTHVSYSVPKREEVWRETFERRSTQIKECGFHGPPYRPYRDVGHVELDDPTLILDGLGQKRDTSASLSPLPEPKSPSSSLPLPLLSSRPQLRSMAPQLPDDLSLLPEEMREVEGRRGEVKVGRGLFESLAAREKAKRKATALREKESARTHTVEWTTSYTIDLNFEPSPRSSRRTSVTNIDIRPSTVTFDLSSSHGNRERRKSVISIASRENLTSNGSRGDVVNNRPLTCESSGVLEMVEEEEKGEEEEEEEDGEEEEVKREEEEEEVESYQFHHKSERVHQWYRTLCVILWVMDGLKLDSLTNLPPFAKCWLLDRDGVARTHLQEVSRSRTHSDNRQHYDHWKHTTMSNNHIKVDPVNPRGGHMTSESHTHPPPSAYNRLWRQTVSREQERLRQQRRLTNSQMEKLIKSVDEELNFSKKAAKSRIKQLQEMKKQSLDAATALSPPPPPLSPPLLLPPLDVERVREKLVETEVTKTMTVHHQLLAMKRDRSQALEQRLVSLRARRSLWKDLAAMREGVKMETTAMARKKLLMNFNWFQDLLEEVPDEIKTDRYCCRLLSLLSDHSHYSSVVGPYQWSKKRLIAILSRLRPWELRCPETTAAVKFLTEKVIYILSEDYDKWLEYHTQELHLQINSQAD